MRIVLCGVQSPINIGMILRSAEIYRVPVLIHDRQGTFADELDYKALSDFACGALQRQPPRVVSSLSVSDLGGRIVCSDTGANAESYLDFAWQPDDNLLIGNEYDGVPGDLAAASQATVTVPMPSGDFPKPRSFSPIDTNRTEPIARPGSPSLNTAVATSAIIAAAYTISLKRT